jgi:hypothetical protein
MKKPSKNSDMLLRLADAIMEDVLISTDDEILKDAAEDYADPALEVSHAKAIFERARSAAGKKRLKAAQEAVQKEKQSGRKVLFMDGAAARRKLDSILRDHPEAGAEFTLAARKGQELSDSDVIGILEDLRELGVYKPEDDGE